MKFFDRFFEAAETVSKVRTLSVLRELPEKQLADCGIDPRLLAEGIRAWPWRAESEENWNSDGSVIKHAVGARVGKVGVEVNENQPVEHDKTAA